MSRAERQLARTRALAELRAEWPEARWGVEDENGVLGVVEGHYVHVGLLEPDEELATETLRWRAETRDTEALGRTAVEAARVAIRRARSAS